MLARLKRDRPDLYEQVQAGAKTAYAAAIEAGFRSRPLTVTSFTPSIRSRRQSKRPQGQSESSHKDPVIIDRGGGGEGPGTQEEPPILRAMSPRHMMLEKGAQSNWAKNACRLANGGKSRHD